MHLVLSNIFLVFYVIFLVGFLSFVIDFVYSNDFFHRSTFLLFFSNLDYLSWVSFIFSHDCERKNMEKTMIV